jgi:hypothetical protein
VEFLLAAGLGALGYWIGYKRAWQKALSIADEEEVILGALFGRN